MENTITFKEIADELMKTPDVVCKVFAYAIVDKDNNGKTQLYASESNAIRFVNELRKGTFLESFELALKEGMSFQKVD